MIVQFQRDLNNLYHTYRYSVYSEPLIPPLERTISTTFLSLANIPSVAGSPAISSLRLNVKVVARLAVDYVTSSETAPSTTFTEREAGVHTYASRV